MNLLIFHPQWCPRRSRFFQVHPFTIWETKWIHTEINKFTRIFTDPQKRAAYDRSGGDPEDRFGGGAGSPADFGSFFGHGGGNRSAATFDGEISPEELFNMFFGGGGGGFAGSGTTFSFGTGGPGTYFFQGYTDAPTPWTDFLGEKQKVFSLQALDLEGSVLEGPEEEEEEEEEVPLKKLHPARYSSNYYPSSFYLDSHYYLRSLVSSAHHPSLTPISLSKLQGATTRNDKLAGLEFRILSIRESSRNTL